MALQKPTPLHWKLRLILAIFGSTLASASAHAKAADEFDFEHVSCHGKPYEIRVVIKNVKKSVGLIVAELYPNNEDGFLKRRGRIEQVRFAAKAPATKFCLVAPNAGDYAVAVYQDENANTDFDKGAFGLPAEPWGLSNNPKVRLAPPPIEKTLFPVNEQGGHTEIKLN